MSRGILTHDPALITTATQAYSPTVYLEAAQRKLVSSEGFSKKCATIEGVKEVVHFFNIRLQLRVEDLQDQQDIELLQYRSVGLTWEQNLLKYCSYLLDYLQ